jgi:hypothetical protein
VFVPLRELSAFPRHLFFGEGDISWAPDEALTLASGRCRSCFCLLCPDIIERDTCEHRTYRFYRADHRLLGGFSGVGGGLFYGTGYYGGGGLGQVIIILIVLLLMGRI